MSCEFCEKLKHTLELAYKEACPFDNDWSSKEAWESYQEAVLDDAMNGIVAGMVEAAMPKGGKHD